MRVVSIGDLVLDYYYKNNKLVGVSGGMTSHNIIANLAKYNINTAVFGVCGNDDMGYVCKKSLEDLKVNIDNVVTLDNVNTRCFHVSYNDEDNKKVFTSKKRCPFCNNKRWYDNSLIDTKNILDNIKEDDLDAIQKGCLNYVPNHFMPSLKYQENCEDYYFQGLEGQIIKRIQF